MLENFKSQWASPWTLICVNRDINSEMALPIFQFQYHNFSIECNSHFSLLSSDCEFNSHISHVCSNVCINTSVISIPNHFILVQQCECFYQNKLFKCAYIHLCLFHSKLSNIQHWWGREEGPQVNKFEQVSSDDHQVSVAGGRVSRFHIWGRG